MPLSGSPKLTGHAVFGALCLLVALSIRRPEFVALASPFLLALVIGLGAGAPPEVVASVSLDRDRVVEGEEVVVSLALTTDVVVGRVDVALVLPPGLSPAAGSNPTAVRLVPGKKRDIRLKISCERWGGYRLGLVVTRSHGALDLIRREVRADERVALRVYPRPEIVRALVRPPRTQVFAGNQVAREAGEGIEFADLRPYTIGDRPRRINWRATARGRQLWVNEFHAERNADVIVMVDSFAELWRGERSSLDQAVRAAAALAERYLRERDRVGIISYGGALAWLAPQMGAAQLYRIADALIETQVLFTYVTADMDLLPTRLLPPRAFVLSLTPLLDDRSERTLADLRARGFDLAVIEISPQPYVTSGGSDTDRVAYQIWNLARDVRRSRIERLGVPVALWDDDGGIEKALQEVNAFWRSARRLLV